MQPYCDSIKKKEYYGGYSRHWYTDYDQNVSDMELMVLMAELSLMADHFTDTYGNQWK